MVASRWSRYFVLVRCILVKCVPLDTQAGTLVHRNGVSMEIAAQAASVTADRPKKHSPATYRTRESKGSHRAAMSQPGYVHHLGALRQVW